MISCPFRRPRSSAPLCSQPTENTSGEARVKREIGIVGAGIGGLHLALYLQKHGVDATIVTDREPGEVRQSRLLNTVAHHHVTIAREDYLGIDHWSDPQFFYGYH